MGLGRNVSSLVTSHVFSGPGAADCESSGSFGPSFSQSAVTSAICLLRLTRFGQDVREAGRDWTVLAPDWPDVRTRTEP